MMALGALFENDNTGAYGLIAMCCYMVGLGISFGPIVWIMMSEIFPGADSRPGHVAGHRRAVGRELSRLVHLPGDVRRTAR